MRTAVFFLCAILVVFVAIYIYKPELLFVQLSSKPAGLEDHEPTDPDENLQFDVPQLDVPQLDYEPTSPPEDLFKHVDGSNLLALVTKQTTIGRYEPVDLELIPGKIVHPGQRKWQYYLRREPLEHLQQMWSVAAEEGVNLTVTSAYRSYDTQSSLFAAYADRDGVTKAEKYSARAGQSEHQLGTTVDFNTDKVAGAEGHAWLAKNAHNFGFAQSYPQGQEHITGYIYEPWHYRYIGVDAAREWKESGLPLCLYLEQRQ